MSYHEGRAIVSLVSTVLINVLYAAYMSQRYPAADAYSIDIFRFWGGYFLILVVVSIVAKILIHIIFAIINAVATREEEPPLADERDKLIELKATQHSIYAFALGFLLAMAALVIDMPPTIMFIILICAGVGSEVISDLSEFYFYRRGF